MGAANNNLVYGSPGLALSERLLRTARFFSGCLAFTHLSPLKSLCLKTNRDLSSRRLPSHHLTQPLVAFKAAGEPSPCLIRGVERAQSQRRRRSLLSAAEQGVLAGGRQSLSGPALPSPALFPPRFLPAPPACSHHSERAEGSRGCLFHLLGSCRCRKQQRTKLGPALPLFPLSCSAQNSASFRCLLGVIMCKKKPPNTFQ